MAVVDTGNNTAGKANVDAQYNLMVNFPGHTAAGVERGGGPENAGAVVFFSENDPGDLTSTRYVRSPETDEDYRLRIALDTVLDRETFNYGSQNTGKHTYLATSLAATVSSSGLLINSANATTGNAGVSLATFAEFPCGMAATAVYVEMNASFSATVAPSNSVTDFGLFRRGAANVYAPTDGVYFRSDANGMKGVICNNSIETQTDVFNFTPGINENNLYTLSVTEKEVEFWINNIRVGSLSAPLANAQLFRSATLPFAIRQGISATASGGYQMTFTDYTISMGGPNVGSGSLGQMGNRTLGSYQGLSGGTMGGLTSYANNTLPTAAVASNTALTANLIAGLGGQCIETDTLAVTTDGIIMSYQIPAGAAAVQGRRLVLTGVTIDTFVQTALTGGGYNEIWVLNFGHTAVSLATTETASFTSGTTKAPRKLVLGSRTVASGLVALTQLPTIKMDLTHPVYVNPGEFIAISKKKIGTAPSAGAMYHTILLDYGWE